jgi:hypothetical protein
MRILRCTLVGLFLLLAIAAQAERLLLCGWDEVFMIDTTNAANGKVEKIWSWRAVAAKGMPVDLTNTFRSTDDCKPVDGGTKILISSSSGGCALVNYPSGNVLWSARVPNAHSIEVLPSERVVVASSVHAEGNRLVLFDLSQAGTPVFDTPLRSAHGVIWDDERECLWALGFDELRSYSRADWRSKKPRLVLKAAHKLPDTGGHELQAIPNSNDLLLTVHDHVYLFDRETGVFRKHSDAGDIRNVKCATVSPVTRTMLIIHGNGTNWWNESFLLSTPRQQIRLPGEKLYKGRWFR